MSEVKARYENGEIILPPGTPRRAPCEVTVIFPEDEGEGAPRRPDRERMRRAAGGWAHMDTEQLKRDIYEARKISTRKPPKL